MRVNPVNQPGIQIQSSALTSGKKVDDARSKPGAEDTFVKTLTKSISDVNAVQNEADAAIENLATGVTKDIAQVMIKAEEAHIAFQFLVQVRNKAIEAYKEIMQMQT